jgi:hypothetical protein
MAQAPVSNTMLSPSSRHTCRDGKKEAWSNCPSPTDQLDYQNHQRNDQQDMDVPRNHVEPDKADQPKYK